MKRALLLCCAFLPMLLNAQSFNVLDTHPAHDTGKMISQEAANSYGVSLAPERFRGDIPEMKKPAVPKYKAEARHQSLFYSGEDGIEHIVAISENDQITYGESVSRNEFGINGGIFWSPNQKKLAFYRKDESRVTDFPSWT